MGKSKKSRHRTRSPENKRSAKRSRRSPERKKEHKSSRSRRESRSPDKRHQTRTKSPSRRSDVYDKSKSHESRHRGSSSPVKNKNSYGVDKIESASHSRRISSPPERRERSKSPPMRSESNYKLRDRSYSTSPERERKSHHRSSDKSSERSRPKKIYNFEVHKSKLVKIFFRETDLIPHSSNEYRGKWKRVVSCVLMAWMCFCLFVYTRLLTSGAPPTPTTRRSLLFTGKLYYQCIGLHYIVQG